ncbi:Rid family hydrolase [Actinoplanes sp. HUAS TT8]|uniref:Rid family hydrolase n=1 Tax=Actinoplanes sp. HUAS TT8 TaxID=3447453 RepID=UPI003F51C913
MNDVPEPVFTGVAGHIGTYADAVVVPAGYESILVSGTPGLKDDGSVPADFAEEASLAWGNVRRALQAKGFDLDDVVSVRQWLTGAADIPTYIKIRAATVRHSPAFMLGVVTQLVWPQLRVEIEVTAVRKPRA